MITIKRGDTGIGLRVTLLSNDVPINLQDCNVLFLFGFHAIYAKIIDPKQGLVEVVFNSIHVKKAGIFKSEFEVSFKDGRIETYPNDEYIEFHIMKDEGGKA